MSAILTPQPKYHNKHWESYPHFIWRSLIQSTEGSLPFYAWMTFLTAVALVGLNAWARQVSGGMIYEYDRSCLLGAVHRQFYLHGGSRRRGSDDGHSRLSLS